MMNLTSVGQKLCLGASLLALGAGTAFAQDGEDQMPAGATVSQTEIIVTAQRRSENLRDVPISVTALNEEMLSKAGVTNTLDIGRVTPGVTIPLYGSYTLPSIRGISSSGAGLGDNTNTAIYIDGVYQSNTNAQLADLPNVQSIQVLKGPQGTLYGQNAAGGAIIIDTVDPSFVTSGKVVAGYGNYDTMEARGYVTGPISQTLAFMVAGAYKERDGFSRDLLRGGRTKGLRSAQARAKLLWEPSDRVSLKLQGYYVDRKDSTPYEDTPYKGNSLGTTFLYLPCDFGGVACLNPTIADEPFETANNIEPDTQVENYGVALIGKFEVGEIGTINTVSAYNHFEVNNFVDVDATTVNVGGPFFPINGRDYIQEVNFISNDFSGFTFTGGVFFMDKIEAYEPNVFNINGIFDGSPPTIYPEFPEFFPYNVFSGTLSDQVAKNHKKSYAVYGELTYELTEQLSITAAGRYAWETQLVSTAPLPVGWRIGDPLPTPVADPRGKHKFSQFTPRAVIRFKPNNDHTIYASYSKGFKSGYVNNGRINACLPRQPNGLGGNDCVDDPVSPETVDAFEIGYKGVIANRLRLSLSAFHYKYKDIQVFVYNPVEGSSYQNAASGKINGAEIEANFIVNEDLTFNVGGSYLDSEYSSYPAATVYLPNPCPPVPTFPEGAVCGNAQLGQDVSGNQLMRTPKWMGNASINYSHDFSAGTFGAYVGGSYNSGVYYDPNNRIKQKPYALLDAEVSFAPNVFEGLRVVVWGKNLTDKHYLSSVLESQIADLVSRGDPRTYGVRLEMTF